MIVGDGSQLAETDLQFPLRIALYSRLSPSAESDSIHSHHRLILHLLMDIWSVCALDSYEHCGSNTCLNHYFQNMESM